METQLFYGVDYENDPHWVAKEFFNSIYQQDRFLWALPRLVERKGVGVNEEYCFFSDLKSLDPTDHFIGVMLCSMGDEITIADEEFKKYLHQACVQYLEHRPEDRAEVERALSREDV